MSPHGPSHSLPCSLARSLPRSDACSHTLRPSEAYRGRANIPKHQSLVASAADALTFSVGGNFNGRLVKHMILPTNNDEAQHMRTMTRPIPSTMLGSMDSGVGEDSEVGVGVGDGMLSGCSGAHMTHITETSEYEVNNSRSMNASLEILRTPTSSVHSQSAAERERELFLM